MKKKLQKVVAFATVMLCAAHLNAQSILKIGDEFDTNIEISQKKYQELTKAKFQNKSTTNGVKEVVYEKEFSSKTASYVKLYFENFDLAPGDYLEITGNETGEAILYGGKGKIVDQNGTTISNFWSRVMLDNKVIVKLYSSGNTANYNGFEIKKVAYGYSEEKIRTQLEASVAQKAICSSDNKESIACYDGTDMFEKAKAVCRLLIGGSGLCTGWLLGSEGNLMTNNHCIGSASDAQNTDFMFNYQYTNCAETSNATADIVASSSTFIKTSSSLDYTLVQLPVNPTSTYGYLSISSTVPSVGDRIYIPQHPGGRRKEISVSTDTGFSQVECVGNCATPLVPQKTINYYADTEGGSSGSPVIDYDSNTVIAIHNTGECPNGSYGRCDDLITSIGSDMPNDGVDGDGTIDPPTPTACSSTVTSFPYSESFEAGDAWTQASGDDGNWTNDASGTPSSNTGPSAGADGSYYMFLEASTNGSTGQIGTNATAILESPCFNLSNQSSATFTFQNHMYGSTVGSLSLDVSTDGLTWTTLWSDSGNQGNQWNSESVSLNSYTGSSEVRLRFSGTTGSSWSSDIAVDDVSLTTTETTSTFPDTTKKYYIDSAHFDYRIGATGASEEPYTTSTATTGEDVEWVFVDKGNGYWHIQRASGGSLSRLRTDNTQYADMQGTGWSGSYTYYELTEGYYDGSYFVTLPDGPTNYRRLQINNSGVVRMVSEASALTWESFTFTEVGESATESDVFEDEVLGNTIKIAPNPIQRGTNTLQIVASASLTDASYAIVNILGQTVKKGFLDTTKTVSIDQLNQGIYILKLESEAVKTTKRFIIK